MYDYKNLALSIDDRQKHNIESVFCGKTLALKKLSC